MFLFGSSRRALATWPFRRCDHASIRHPCGADCVVSHPAAGGGAKCAPRFSSGCAGSVRLLCAFAVVVAVVLRGSGRATRRRLSRRAMRARAYSFVVHGLWPQYVKGFPENCQIPSPRLYRGIVSSMLDLMPAPHLIYNEWDKHGTCSGLAPTAYFDDRAQRARGGENSARLYRSASPAHGRARRGGGCLRQSKSGLVARRHRDRMRQDDGDRGPALPGRLVQRSCSFTIVRTSPSAAAGAINWSCRRCAAATADGDFSV